MRERLRGYGISSMLPALVYGPETMAQHRAISMGWGVRNAGIANPSLLNNGEFANAFEVDTLLDVIDPNDGYTSLREAIISANTFAGYDLITFASGHFPARFT